ncbi:MAG: hypothetical protein R3C97_18495 [Geminicoccaceae bacterium]
MKFLKWLLSFLAELVFTIIGPILLIVAGLAIIALGFYWDMSWISSTGAVVTALGGIIAVKTWSGED